MTSNPSPRRRVIRRTVVGLAAAALTISACGSSDDASTDGTATVSDSSAGATGSDVATTEAGAQGIQQNRPVTVEGIPLQPFDQAEAVDPAVGEASPVISGETFDGTPITFGGESDNPTLVVFLAHWCPHCNAEVPALIELDDSGGLPDGLDVIGVSTGVDESAPNYPPSEWADEKGWPWPMMADDENATAIKAMGGTAFPFAVVLDTDGTVLARRAGEAPASETQVFLDDALGN